MRNLDALPPKQLLFTIPDGGHCYGCDFCRTYKNKQGIDGELCFLRWHDPAAYKLRPGPDCRGAGRYELKLICDNEHEWLGMEDE